ncbi:hypothetical protein AB3N04_02190 [Alkalihalophilus sp. As8PL]|uniref:Uncharacterized protein n=1 Tax=Alkalihalophilus sp. As8PL TaxID=3237103 RepID=A0AB39BV05_9BACI
MDGVYFYWVGWIYLCLITFFWPKNSRRTVVAIFMFTLLIVSPKFVTVQSIQVSLGYVFMIGVFYGYLTQLKTRSLLYILPTSLIVAASYASFQLVSIYDPVVHLIDGRIMSMAIVVTLSCIMTTKWSLRLLIAILGLLHGELLYGLTVSKTFMVYSFGEFYLLDVMALTSALIGSGWYLHHLSSIVHAWSKRKNSHHLSDELYLTKD